MVYKGLIIDISFTCIAMVLQRVIRTLLTNVFVVVIRYIDHIVLADTTCVDSMRMITLISFRGVSHLFIGG